MVFNNPRIPVGSWVLVTGVNGMVASNVANLLLESGYKVRGSVRDPTKVQWLKERFDKSFGEGNFELVAVEDLAAEGAFDKAVEGTFPQQIVRNLKYLTFNVLKVSRELFT
jgi:nucleoside-diphosphate-sugar epimerase